MRMVIQSQKVLGNALLKYRQHRKLNQTETGAEFMINQTTISSIENGAPGTRLETLFRLMSALDLEMIIQPKEAKQEGEW